MLLLVTGATGKVGRQLLEVLREQGVPHRAASRNPEPGPDTVRFDWNDDTTWASALDGVTHIWVVPQAAGAYDVSETVIDFLDRAVADNDIAKVGVLSVRNAQHLNKDLPALKVEQHLAAGSTPWFSLRPTWFYQNLTEGMFRRSLEDDNTLRAPTGDGQVSFIDTLDIAEAAAAAFVAGPDIQGEFELTGPDAMTFGELADKMTSIWSRPIAHEDVTIEAMEAYLAGLGLVPTHVAALTNHFRRIRTGASAEVTDGVRQLTDKDARTFADFLSRTRPEWILPK